MGFWLYAEEHKGVFPWSGGQGDAECLRVLHGSYVPEIFTFVCPSDSDADAMRGSGQRGQPVDPEGLAILTELNGPVSYRASYDYFGVYTEQPLRAPAPPGSLPRIPLMWDIGTSPELPQRAQSQINNNTLFSMLNHVPGGSNVLWMDGTVTFVPVEAFDSWNLPYRPAGIAFAEPFDIFEQLQPPAPPPPEPFSFQTFGVAPRGGTGRLVQSP